MTPNESDVAAKVRGIAAERRIKQEQIAEVLGVSRNGVVRRYNGTTAYSTGDLIKLSRFFNVPVATFFGEIADPIAQEALAEGSDAPHKSSLLLGDEVLDTPGSAANSVKETTDTAEFPGVGESAEPTSSGSALTPDSSGPATPTPLPSDRLAPTTTLPSRPTTALGAQTPVVAEARETAGGRWPAGHTGEVLDRLAAVSPSTSPAIAVAPRI